MKKLITTLTICFAALFATAQKKSVLLLNGTAHLVTGETINNSAIAFKDGKLTLVANALVIKLDLTKFDTVINIEGKHVYPGFIGANATIGLNEIESTRSTHDYAEVGTFNPDVRTQIAYNTDSRVIPTVRSNGILLAQITPRGGIFSGTSSIMTIGGWNWEDATVKVDDGIHLNWPQQQPRRRGGEEQTAEDEYAKQVTEIKKFLTEAKAYATTKDQKALDVRFESLRGLFNGKKTLFIHCNFVKEMTEAVLICRDLGIEKKSIVGGYESYLISGLLKENKVSVVLRNLHELPMRDDEDIDLQYKLPALLQEAGILYCIQNEGNQEASHLRNLPFIAATGVGYGITKEDALKSITINAAKILGIDDQYGSLEPGKSATLFVSDGDALDMRTNKVTMAWIRGEFVSLDDHHKRMYKKYMDKYSKK